MAIPKTSVLHTVSLPPGVARRVRSLATRQKTSASRVTVDLILRGLDARVEKEGFDTDVAADAFCPFVLEIFYLGITTGTTPTTCDPTSSVSRLQMAAFLSRAVDGVLKRGSRRATLDQFWTTGDVTLGVTTVGGSPSLLKSDGADVWVANYGGTVSRVRGSDGKLLETWTGATNAFGVLVAMGRVLVTGDGSPGQLYRIDPTQPPGDVTTVASNLGDFASGVAFDGTRIWTANSAGSVSIVTPGTGLPWTVTTVTAGFNQPFGALFDGSNVWVTDGEAAVLKLDSSGAVIQSVSVGGMARYPAFDGSNIWVPLFLPSTINSVSVVRASSGAVLRTLTGNGLDQPTAAAFDWQRIVITNSNGNSVSLWKAADLTPLGSFFFRTGPGGLPSGAPFGACSDGVNFWVALNSMGQVARF